MSDSGSPLTVGPGEGKTIQGPVGGPLTYKARGEQTGGSLTVLENEVAPGEGPPLHVHENEDEAWYVLEGALRLQLEGEVRSASTGSFAFVPRGVPHCFQNLGDQPARVLVIFTPAGMERFFDRFAALPDAAAVPKALRSIGSEVGMEVVGAPLAQSGR